MAEYLELEKVLDDSNIITVQTKEYGSIEVIPVDTITDIELADVQPVDSKPVKIVEGDFEVQGYLVKEKYYCCPNCELTFGNLKIDNLLTLVHENKFCKECGQKLDWDSIMSETIKG